VQVVFSCRLNTVVAMTPQRLAVPLKQPGLAAGVGGSSSSSRSGSGSGSSSSGGGGGSSSSSSSNGSSSSGSSSSGGIIWVQSLTAVRDAAERGLIINSTGGGQGAASELAAAVTARLRELQREMSARNNHVSENGRAHGWADGWMDCSKHRVSRPSKAGCCRLRALYSHQSNKPKANLIKPIPVSLCPAAGLGSRPDPRRLD